MTRSLRKSVLALVAMVVSGGLTVTGAVAEETQGMLTSDGPVTLDITEIGTEINSLTAFGVEISCPGSTYTGHGTATKKETEENPELEHELIEEPASTFTADPHYNQSTCLTVEESGLKHKTTVTDGNCQFHFELQGTVSSSQYEVEADIECPGGHAIEIETYPFAGSEIGGVACRVTIVEQTGLKGAEGEPVVAETVESSNPHDLEIHGTFTGIHLQRTGISVCSEEPHTSAVGEYHINATVEGTNSNGDRTEITVTDSRE